MRAMTDILSLRAGQCRFCTSDDTPFVFCAAPVSGESAYCAEHHALCHSGFGRVTAEALETMIYRNEQTVMRTGNHHRDGQVRLTPASSDHTLAVDVVVRG